VDHPLGPGEQLVELAAEATLLRRKGDKVDWAAGHIALLIYNNISDIKRKISLVTNAKMPGHRRNPSEAESSAIKGLQASRKKILRNRCFRLAAVFGGHLGEGLLS
jgi:hypothetical protein